MKTFLIALLLFCGKTLFAFSATEIFTVDNPTCTRTSSYTARASHECNGELTFYTVTRSCTFTDPDCSTASGGALACAIVKAQQEMRRIVSLIQPCDGGGGPLED